MSVYKRGNTWWVKFQLNGQEIRRSAKTEKKREAEAYERKLRERVESDLKSGQLGQSLKRTCGDALIKWIEQGAPQSMYSHIRNVRPHIENVLLTNAVPAAAEMKEAMLADGLNPQTINRRLAVIRRLLNVAYKQWEWIREPLGDRISTLMMSEKEYSRHIYLQKDEFLELCANITNPEVVTLLIGLASTGLRLSEALNLQPSGYKDGTIFLNAQTKGKKARAIPVPVYALPIFDNLPFKANYDAVRFHFERARKLCGHPEWRIHDLRHTFASWLIKDPTIPLTVVRDILGHSNLSVTSRYSHLRGDSLRSAVDSLPNLIISGTKPGTLQ